MTTNYIVNKTLSQLTYELGYAMIPEFVEAECSDSVCWGVCGECGFAEQDLEPDGSGTCPECGSDSYKSVLLWLGYI